jgi:hypothetical protein
MIQVEGLHTRLLCNVVAIARALSKYDRIAFIELLCESQEAPSKNAQDFLTDSSRTSILRRCTPAVTGAATLITMASRSDNVVPAAITQ